VVTLCNSKPSGDGKHKMWPDSSHAGVDTGGRYTIGARPLTGPGAAVPVAVVAAAVAPVDAVDAEWKAAQAPLSCAR